jgi:anti-sigma B factor antagonist
MLESHAFAIGLTRTDDRPVVMSLSGELDIAGAPELADAFASVARSDARAVVVDLSTLTFIDSTGISVLATAAREARARGGELIVAAPSGDVRSVLEIVRFADIVALEDSLPAAFQRLGAADAA